MIKGSIQILLIVFVSVSAAAAHALLPIMFPSKPDEGILYSISNTQHGTYAGWEKCLEDESYQTCNSAVSQFKKNKLAIISINVGDKTCENDPTKVAVTIVNTSENTAITGFHLRPYFLVGGEYDITFLPVQETPLLPRERRSLCLFQVWFKEAASREALKETPVPIKLHPNHTRGTTI